MIDITPNIRTIGYTVIMINSLIFAGYFLALKEYVVIFVFLAVGLFSYTRFLRANNDLINQQNGRYNY